MAKAKAKSLKESPRGLIFFVEGETDYHFYNHLINHLKLTNPSKKVVDKVIVKNLKGVGNYNAKPMGFFKFDVLPKYKSIKFDIFCCYDTDVFEQASKPAVNWSKVKKELISLGAKSVHEIQAVRMIEDWFLYDIGGLSKFLKANTPVQISSLKGHSAVDKMNNLFKKHNKIYTKGYYCENFLDCLDFKVISNRIQSEINIIEAHLFI